MSSSSEKSWFNDSNAPQDPPALYIIEKGYFFGIFTGAIFYGIAIALFFRCMGVLLSPTNPIKKGVKWALVAHTVAMFLFVTIPYGIGLNYPSIDYIDNRDFPGGDGLPPGPIGYSSGLNAEAAVIVLKVMFPLNQWLADGLLLHRCYVIYSMNHRVMAIPCLLYLASVAMGVAHACWRSGTRVVSVTSVNFNTSYLSICLSLNILLTLMIVMRIILHIRAFKKAIGASSGFEGLHTVAAMLIESYALYAITLLLYIVPWALEGSFATLFNGALGAVQVIAPYLITLRVAKRRALTSDSISGIAESIRFRSQGTVDGGGSLPDEGPANLMEVNAEFPGGLGARDESAIEEVPL